MIPVYYTGRNNILLFKERKILCLVNTTVHNIC